jgi:hypothetical protein
VAKFVLRSPVLKVQFASQQFPHSGSGNLPNLLCLADLFIVDFEPERQHFFLVVRLTLFPEGAAPSSWIGQSGLSDVPDRHRGWTARA